MASRKNKKRRRRNRGRFSFLYVLLSVLLITAALVAGSVVFFRADTITVSGNIRYTSEEIISAAQVQTGDNLFGLDRKEISRRILTSLPYIQKVSIRPAFPAELRIIVTESRAAVSLQGPEGWFLLDPYGKLVEAGTGALQEKAPVVRGLSPQTPSVGTYLATAPEETYKLNAMIQLLTALETHEILNNLRFLDVTASNQILFGYTERFTVKIPMNCDFDYKIRALEYVVNALEENETGLIDLTDLKEVHVIPN